MPNRCLARIDGSPALIFLFASSLDLKTRSRGAQPPQHAQSGGAHLAEKNPLPSPTTDRVEMDGFGDPFAAWQLAQGAAAGPAAAAQAQTSGRAAPRASKGAPRGRAKPRRPSDSDDDDGSGSGSDGSGSATDPEGEEGPEGAAGAGGGKRRKLDNVTWESLRTVGDPGTCAVRHGA